MRGTGCSGGAFDYFEPLQSLDGYDVVETVARQPWVLHHKVGLMGISYGGISQLFVAATNPPHLAAITPLSVVDDSATTLYPGGILNTGFALPWARSAMHDAKPASSTGGEPWALAQIKAGDTTCKANQALHDEAVNLVAKVHANKFYVPAIADPSRRSSSCTRSRSRCTWPASSPTSRPAATARTSSQHFTGTAHKWFTFTNGVHTDSLDPATFNRWYDFLELYVARQAPNMPAAVKAGAPTIYQTVQGVDGVTLPADPLQGLPSYGAALAAFERLPQVRILFDNGAGSTTRRQPAARLRAVVLDVPAARHDARARGISAPAAR